MSQLDQNELFLVIGRLEGKVDSLREQIKAQGDAHMGVESRIRTLENNAARAIGLATGVSLILTGSVQLLIYLANKAH